MMLRVVVFILLLTCVCTHKFISTYTDGYEVYLADLDSKTGNSTMVSKGSSLVINGFSCYDPVNHIYAISDHNITTSPPASSVFYSWLKSGVPSQTLEYKLPMGFNLLAHSLLQSSNQAIIVTGGYPSYTISVWTVDLDSASLFNTTFLFNISIDNVDFETTLMTIDQEGNRIFLLGYDESSGSTLYWFSLTGELLGQLESLYFSLCVSITYIDDIIYGVGIDDFYSFDLQSKVVEPLASVWCEGNGMMWNANAGMHIAERTAFVVMECNNAQQWFTIYTNGTASNVTNPALEGVYGLQALGKN